MNTQKFAIPLIVALSAIPTTGFATPILGPDLASFAVLGASTVTNTGATTIDGNLGVSPGSSITGLAFVTLNGSLHQSDATASLAQSELSSAISYLALMGAGSTTAADLVGLTLFPGVYTVPAGVSNLTGALTLDGQGNANAAWVFQLPSTLITSAGSSVNLINTGAGAGVYWNVGSSATFDTTTSFLGNVLSYASIGLNQGASISCGRALASTAAVTMNNNTIDATDCNNGLSGGLDVNDGAVSFLPYAAIGATVPEPSAWM